MPAHFGIDRHSAGARRPRGHAGGSRSDRRPGLVPTSTDRNIQVCAGGQQEGSLGGVDLFDRRPVDAQRLGMQEVANLPYSERIWLIEVSERKVHLSCKDVGV